MKSRLDELYPDHCRALSIAGLLPDEVPQMRDVLKDIENSQRSKNTRKRPDRRKRETLFCIGMSSVWRGKHSLPVKLKKLRNKHNLKWLRISMSYHRFPNLLETLQGDLCSKLNEPWYSADFMERPCNCCRRTRRENGTCLYGGECRKSVVVYKATCHDESYYIGSTQQHLKDRMDQHFGEVRDKINHGKPADSFARHCALKLEERERDKVSAHDARKLVKEVDILWWGDPLSCVKSFGQLTCRLCQKERIYIHKAKLKDKIDGTCKLINSCNEFYGACRHIPKFHRYQREDSSTDDG